MSLYAPVPGHWVDELPNQSLQSIAYGFLTYWHHTGDVATIRTMLPAIVRYLLSYNVTPQTPPPATLSSSTSSSSSSSSASVSSSPVTAGMLVAPRACPGEPHAADVQCPGIWDWCDGQSTNCDYAPIDNAWYVAIYICSDGFLILYIYLLSFPSFLSLFSFFPHLL